jgi:hypothetical protein
MLRNGSGCDSTRIGARGPGRAARRPVTGWGAPPLGPGAAGEIAYDEFGTALERMDIPPTFWILALEPRLVRRRGGGAEANGALGDGGGGGGDSEARWAYELQADGGWDSLPEISDGEGGEGVPAQEGA